MNVLRDKYLEDIITKYYDDEKFMIHIFVVYDGGRMTITMKRTDTIEELKEILHKQLGIPYYSCQLVFGSQHLCDHHTLEYYGIRDESTIFNVKPLTGG